MEIDLNAEQEVQLSVIASVQGKKTEELAREVFARGLEAESRFLHAVKAGQDAAAQGDFVDHALIWPEIEQILQS